MMSALEAFPNLISLEIHRLGPYSTLGDKFTWTDLVRRALEHSSLQELRLYLFAENYPDVIRIVQQSSRLRKLTIADPNQRSIDILVSMPPTLSKNIVQSLEELRFMDVSLFMLYCIPPFRIDQSQFGGCIFQWNPKFLESFILRLQNVKCLNLSCASPDADELPLLSHLPNLKELTIRQSSSVGHFLSLLRRS
jgi:hypothetical protein